MNKGIKRLAFSLFVLISSVFYADAQTVYLQKETFEAGRKPDGWTEEAVVGTVPWRYRNGGYNPSDPNLTTPAAQYDMFRNPDGPKNGTYNAWFFTQGFGREQTKLISPPLDLRFAVTPSLTFWLTLYDWVVPTGINNDILRVYYKVGAKGGWNLLQTYNFKQRTWRDFQISLPPGCIANNVYIAFEGLSRWGMGVCLDDIEITETGSKIRSLDEVTTETVTTEVIPNGTANNPILCSRFKVTGNQSNATLNSIAVNAKGTNIADITSVKAYLTTEPVFSTSTLVASGTLNGSSVNLTSTYNLPTGYSYLWITYDIAATAKSGNYVDGEIPVNGINVNGATSAATIINSPGTRTIKQNLFFDDFETNKGWSLFGDFEIAAPQGKTGTIGNADPTYAVSGSKVLGNDLTVDGVYDANVPWNTPYTATSPSFDALFYKGLILNYKRWLNVDLFDTVRVQASLDNGVTWVNLWNNTDYVLDDGWASHSVAFPSQFDRANNIKVRFSLASNDNREFTGWNIDDVSVIGNYMEKDLAVTGIVSPVSTCGSTTTAQPITIKVKNAGSKEAVAPIPVKIFFNNTTIDDNITQNIAPGAEATITLSKTIPADQYGYFKVLAQTLLPNDEDAVNDTLSTKIYISRTFDTPYTTGFDTADDWIPSGKEWQHGQSTSATIQGDTDTDALWMTQLNGNYSNSSFSTLTSPCFNIVGLEKPILEFKTNFMTEDGKDGFSINYSLDNGVTWIPLPNNGDAWDNLWSWNTQKTVQASGKNGFTGNSNGWITVSHLLPAALNGTTNVKFRFEFASDAQNNIFEGIGLNEFTIKEAPDDFGVSAITYPNQLTGTSTCQGFTEKEKIKFKLKNLGLKTAKAGTTVKVAFQSDYTKPGGTSVNRTEKFEEDFTLPADLAVNSEVEFSTTNTIDMDRGGNYDISATSKDDPLNFYLTNNDQFKKSVYVNKPYVDLGDDVYLLNPTGHQFNITTDVSGTNYGILWEKKGKQDVTWTTLGNGASESVLGTDFTSTNNKMTYRVTLTDQVSGCKVSSIANVYKYNPDITIAEITSPIDTCSLSDKQKVTVKLKNNGQDIDTIKAGTILKLNLKFGTAVKPEIDYTVSKDITPGEFLSYTFPYELDMSATQTTYSLETGSTLVNDVNTANDKLSANIQAFGYPNFVLTPQSQTIKALDYTYDAGAGFNAYLWDDASTAQTNKVTYPGPASGKIWCSVTDNNGCSTKSEAAFTFEVTDIAVNGIKNITSECTHDPTLKPTLTVENKGNVTIASGTVIPVDIDVNGTTEANTFTLQSDLLAGDAVDVTLDNALNLSATGDYSLLFTLKLTDDLVAQNDTISTKIKTYGLPKSSLQRTISTRNVDIMLDAGSGFTDYMWSTQEMTQTIQVAKSGQYTVRVTDVNGCSAVDTSDVTFLRKDLKVEITSTYGNNNSVCTGTTEYPVTITLSNTGNDVINAGEVIPASIKFGTLQVTENVTLAADLQPGSSVDYTFSQKISCATATTTALSALINYNDEILTNNFSSIVNITGIQTPTISLGADLEIVNSSYSLTPTVSPDLSTNTFVWNNGGTSKSITISQGGTYIVTVNNNGCTASDTIDVVFKKRDLRINSIISPIDSCYTTKDRIVTLTYENSGYEAIPAGETITLAYTLGTQQASESFTLANTMPVGQENSYTFTQKVSNLTAGTYSLEATIDYSQDGLATNNSFTKQVVIKPLPTINLPAQQNVNGMQIQLDGPDNMASYSWSTSESTQSITVNKDGIYTLTVVDNNGCGNTASTQVLFNADIELTSIANPGYCQSTTPAPLVLTVKNAGINPIVSGTSTTISGTINGNAFTETYTFTADLASMASRTIQAQTTLPISAAGTYDATVELALSGEQTVSNNSQTVQVTVKPTPVISLPASINSTNLSETLTGPSGMASYSWSTGETTQSITVSTSGTYSLTVINSDGCSASASTVVSFKSNLELTSIDNAALCKNSAAPIVVTIKNNSSLSIPAGAILSFTGTANGNAFTEQVTLTASVASQQSKQLTLTTLLPASTAGQYGVTVNVSYNDGSSTTTDAKTTTITINDLPVISLSPTIDSYESSVTLSGPAGMTTYSWSTGETTQNITVSSSGTYTLTVTNSNGCSATASSTVTFNAGVELVSINNGTVCQSENGDPISITIQNKQSSAIPAGTVLTIKGDVNGTAFIETKTLAASLASNQSVTLTLAQALNQTAVGQYTINVEVVQGSISGSNNKKAATITVNAKPTISLPAVISSYKTGETLTGPAGMASYQWSTGETTQSIAVTQSGTYTLTVTNASGCSTTASTQVTFNTSISLVAITNTSICQGSGSEPLSVSVKNQSPYTIVSNSILTLSGDINGVAFSEKHTITADLASQQLLTVTLSAQLPNTTAGQYAVNVQAVLDGEQTFASNKISTSITVNPAPSFTLPADVTSNKASETLTGPAGMASYLWSTGETTQSITVSQSGTYTLKVTNGSGCSSSQSTTVTFKRGDIALKAIANAANSCQSSTGIPVQLQISNEGSSTIAKGEVLSVTGTIDGVAVSESYTLTEDLLAQGSQTITIGSTIPASTAGKSITVSLNVSYSYDINKANDAASKTVTIAAIPSFNVNMTLSSDKSQATLTPDKSDLTYSWSNGATSAAITVYENGSYTVTGTNASGCSFSKVITIDFIVPKSTNFLMVYPAVTDTKCFEGGSRPFIVNIVNESLSTIVKQGTTVQVDCSYQVTKPDGSVSEMKFSESLILSSDLAPGAKTTHQFTKMIALGKQVENNMAELAGKQVVTGYTTINGLKSLEKSTQFEIFALPKVEFGKDTLYRALPTVLKIDLTSDYTFVWNTGETANNILISNEGEYWVKVTGKNGCVASDTVYVKEGSENPTILLNIYPNPASSKVNIEAFYQSKEDMFIDIFTSTGLLMISKKFELTTSAILTSYDISGLAPGNYVVVVRTKDKKTAKIMVIAR